MDHPSLQTDRQMLLYARMMRTWMIQTELSPTISHLNINNILTIFVCKPSLVSNLQMEMMMIDDTVLVHVHVDIHIIHETHFHNQ